MIPSKCILPILLALLSFSQHLPAQQSLQFADRVGNQFVLLHPQQLPRKVNAQFLQRELKADSLHASTEAQAGPWTFEIHEIRAQEGQNYYDIRLMCWPQNATAFERGTRYLGYTHYDMQVGRVRGRWRILRLRYDHGEI